MSDGEEPDCLTCDQHGMPDGCEECGRVGSGPGDLKWRPCADPWADQREAWELRKQGAADQLPWPAGELQPAQVDLRDPHN